MIGSELDHKLLRELMIMKMPFGKYAGRRLVDLPEPYVVWFARKGFPPGKLGRMLAIVHEIKINGLEYLFQSFPAETVEDQPEDDHSGTSSGRESKT
ncbi:MAG: DUF3820 family protein [Desulforhopalus sp.]|nr:DUF3820 family protein [Desulforhopalus sp.]